MEDNPFSAIVQQIKNISKEQIPTVFRMGRVVSIEPLRVETGGIVLEKNEIYLNKMIIDSGIQAGMQSISSAEIDSIIHQEEICAGYSPPILSIGDQVVMISESDAVFYLLCKVVRQ